MKSIVKTLAVTLILSFGASNLQAQASKKPWIVEGLVISDLLSVVISPQSDIAFVDKAGGFTGSTAWVWPITAGVALKF